MLAQLHRNRGPQHLCTVSGHQQRLKHRLGQSIEDGDRAPGFNEHTRWTSEVGDRVSFFVIAGNTTNEIYAGYRLLTGTTPMLPKAAYGFIQCKQRYSSQDEVLGVAKGYRDRHLPLDVVVVDWFYWTKMDQIDMDPVKWPDPAAMNRQFHEMGLVAVRPRRFRHRYHQSGSGPLVLGNHPRQHLEQGLRLALVG